MRAKKNKKIESIKQGSAEELKKIVLRWMEEGWQKGNTSIIDQLHSADFIDHDPSGRDPSNEGFKDGIKQLYQAFPDFYCVVEDLIPDPASGKVAVRWRASGTHQGELMGITPTGKRIGFKGIEIVRIKDGLITERWGEWDGIEILQQLGVIS